MKVQRFEVPGLAQFSYVVSSEGKAVVVDAIRDIDRYLAYAVSEGLQITHVLETHIHADFAAGSVALAESTGASLALSMYDEGEHYRYSMPHQRLRDGDEIAVGVAKIRVLHTPGHTPEHLSFLLSDADETKTLLSGDFLFAGGLGRPDLLGDEAKVGLARELYRSLHERIAALPDELKLYPGHGAGSLCGAGIGDHAETTLGYEREHNFMLRLDEESFVKTVLETVPEMPSYYPRMKALNARGADVLKKIPGERALAVVEVAQLLEEEDVVVIDLRSPEAFAQGHIPGAINLGANGNLALWAGWILDAGKRSLLVGDGGNEEESRLALIRVGLDQIEGYLAGGMKAWISDGRAAAQLRTYSVDEVVHRNETALLLDVRNTKEWDDSHIEGARRIALGELNRSLDLLPRDRPVVTICGSGYRASVAASLLARNGFGNVGWMEGGMTEWERAKASKRM